MHINACIWNLEKWYRRKMVQFQNRNRDADVENECEDMGQREGEGGGGMIGRLDLT